MWQLNNGAENLVNNLHSCAADGAFFCCYCETQSFNSERAFALKTDVKQEKMFHALVNETAELYMWALRDNAVRHHGTILFYSDSTAKVCGILGCCVSVICWLRI